MVSPYAAFDSLYIAAALKTNVQYPVIAEVHVLAYLAVLLSLYRGQPVSDWGYGFAGTRDGSPFSPEIDGAIRALTGTGLLRSSEGRIGITESGTAELSALTDFSQNRERVFYLEPACSSTLTMPVGVIRHALAQEPTLKPTSRLVTTRPLLDGPYMSKLYDQFEALGRTVGVEHHDLLIPATVWLGYLWRASEMQDDRIAVGTEDAVRG
ncbi:MAG TPA: hypothetical protein VK752_05945 [Bryobacteraceae bacterium]|jgi:hypothetical protein|nr:hypothetical protein [Bryobacteraceae bacterium]